MQVLVVEDDDKVARGLVRALTHQGYQVRRAATVADAMERIAERTPDLALVDMGLPDGSGQEVLRRLRDLPASGSIVVTARGEEHERVIGLRSGADDYVVKPFSLAELLARVEAVSRRTRALRRSRRESPVVRHGDWSLDTQTRLLEHVEGSSIALTEKESGILTLLMEAGGAVVTRAEFVDQVWGEVEESSSRTLDTHMASLRTKLPDSVEILTVRGAGYRLGQV